MELGLADRVFVVTGGSSGLGRASAEALVAEGARVIVSGRSADKLLVLQEQLGADCVTVVADNADPETPGRLISSATDRWGRLDGALISVGGPAPGSAVEATDEQWSAAFESVFLGTTRLARELGRVLAAESGGALALVLSTSVRSPVPGLAISNGLRPGLAMLAKTLADELGPRGVRVNGLLPGRLDTDRVAELDAASGDPAASRERWSTAIPLGRYGEPEEFGRVAAFLLSPAASYLTGIMVPVDGGLLRGI
jgi:3-oxoacyl-[acyl-carrier protein] reductase